MGDERTPASDTQEWTGMGRRRFLRAVGATTATAVVASAPAVAQEQRYVRRMVIPRVEQFSKDYVGRFVLLSDPLQSEPKASVIEGCEFADWSVEETDVYEALVVDRHQSQEAVTIQNLYMKAGTDYEPGTLFIVNEQSSCPENYVGLRVSQVPDERLPPINNSSRQTVPETTQGDGGASTFGQPGFGPIAALSGLAGAAWYRLLRD